MEDLKNINDSLNLTLSDLGEISRAFDTISLSGYYNWKTASNIVDALVLNTMKLKDSISLINEIVGD